jgi:hypothetical protein
MNSAIISLSIYLGLMFGGHLITANQPRIIITADAGARQSSSLNPARQYSEIKPVTIPG